MTFFSVSFARRSLPAAVVALLLGSCMTRPPAPVSEIAPPPPEVIGGAPPSTEEAPPPTIEAPPTHVVKRGETLYQIALDHGLDYRELAAWNNIENINLIRAGRVLVLTPPEAAGASGPGSAVTTPLAAAPAIAPVTSDAASVPFSGAAPSGRSNSATFKTEPKAIKLPYSEQALAQMRQSNAIVPPESASPAGTAAAGPASPSAIADASPAAPATGPAPGARVESPNVPEIDGGKIDWAWPATGKVIAGFSESANLKGIDIAGKAGQPVYASGAGKVVYAGSGLRGYGKLIIVKHNKVFLSAYAHNREILVKEGQQVAKGQKIAEMGDTDADQVMLHFEIRRFGKPVDPAKFLPPG